MSTDSHSESSPLLERETENDFGSGNQEHDHRAAQGRSVSRFTALKSHLRMFAPVYLCGLFLVVVDLPGYIAEVNRVRMYELAVCRDWYSHTNKTVINPVDGDIPEELCKIPAVQSELADFSGLQMLLDELVGLLLVVPYGMLADIYGRRIVIALCLIGIVIGDMWTAMVLIYYQTFSTRVALVSSAFRIIGGGQTVIIPIILAIVSDSVPPELRTRAFFYLTVLFPVTELIGPPIGSHFLTTVGPHLTFLIFNPFCLFGLVVLWFMPETLQTNAAEHDELPGVNEPFSMRNRIHSLVDHIQTNAFPLLKRPWLFIALMAVFVNRLPRPLLGLLLQYMSAKFYWKLAQSNYLLSLQALVQIVLFLLILPTIQTYLIKRVHNPQYVDLRLSRGSAIFLFVGTLMMGLANLPVIFITGLCITVLGGGYVFSLRSYVTSLVAEDDVAFLYTIIAVFEAVGTLISTPLLAKALAKGIKWGGAWVGLPFLIVASLYALSGFITWLLPVLEIQTV